jgi:putative tryptophan/tyrosine transport system substrate-binding protein
MWYSAVGCLVTLVLSLLVAPLTAETPPTGKVARIGFLAPGTATTGAGGRQAFTERLRQHGWIEGQNLTIEYRWAEGQYERLPDLAADLAQLPLDAIFAVNTPTALAMQRTGTTRPVVFAIVSEPVEIGLVESLARPGRNFTGLTTINRELMAKRLEVLKETIPTLTRVGYLANPDYVAHAAQRTEMEAAAHRLGLTLHLAEVQAAFARLAAARVGAFIVQQDALFGTHRALVIEAAIRHRLPSMAVWNFYPPSGGLMSYGAKSEDLIRRTADYMDKILKGAKPSDLPVERPMQFELVINLKTANALGLTIPPTILFQADEVIR